MVSSSTIEMIQGGSTIVLGFFLAMTISETLKNRDFSIRLIGCLLGFIAAYDVVWILFPSLYYFVTFSPPEIGGMEISFFEYTIGGIKSFLFYSVIGSILIIGLLWFSIRSLSEED